MQATRRRIDPDPAGTDDHNSLSNRVAPVHQQIKGRDHSFGTRKIRMVGLGSDREDHHFRLQLQI